MEHFSSASNDYPQARNATSITMATAAAAAAAW